MPRVHRSRPSTQRGSARRPLAAGWLGVPTTLWAAVALAVLLAWLAQVLGARAGVADEAALRNQQAAQRLAGELVHERVTPADAPRRLAALLPATGVELVRWTDADGATIAQAVGALEAAEVPDWFVRIAPLTPAPGLATLMLQGRPTELRVSLSMVATWQALWRGAQCAALVLAALAAAALTAIGLTRAGWARVLARLVRCLRSPDERDGTALALAPQHLLRPIAEAAAHAARERSALLAAHAEQLEALRRHAHLDAVTGLPSRRGLVAELARLLDADAGGAGLVLLRVRDLYGLNLRCGHARIDRALQALAELLRAYPRQAPGCVLGRLNGSDFALALPVAGQALATAQSLLAALRPLLGPLDAAAGAAIAALELQRPTTVADALALADEVLARAEVMGRFALEALGQAGGASLGGEANWQERIRRALDADRVRLDEQALCTADGRLWLLECSLRLQLDDRGAFEPASRWLGLAARSRLLAAADLRAVELALQAIGDDGIGRSVDIAAASLATPGFIVRTAQTLAQAADSAYKLRLAIAEATAGDHPELVREASARWRATGALVALRHAGEVLARSPQLLDLGLDSVGVDARWLDGIGGESGEQARCYLRALVRLIQSVGLQVTAEGVASPSDLAWLWKLGFDAAAGPATGAVDPAPGSEPPGAADAAAAQLSTA